MMLLSSRQPSKADLKQLGKIIRAARERKNLSLRAFAKDVGLSPSYVSKVERGLTRAGTLTYEAMCELLGIDTKTVLSKAGFVDRETSQLFEAVYFSDPVRTNDALKGIRDARIKSGA